MIKHFEFIISKLFDSVENENPFCIFDPSGQFDVSSDDYINTIKSLNASFLISLAGSSNIASARAEGFLKRMAKSSEWADLADFYLAGKKLILNEIESVCAQHPDFTNRLKRLYNWLSYKGSRNNAEEITEKIWSVFFPEGTGINEARQEQIDRLRAKRTVRITSLNASPLTDPGKQLLFTSNVLLTVPDESMKPDGLALSKNLKQKIFQAAREKQAYWYDHPIQIGVKPELNEIFYGLHGLSEAVEFERSRGNMPGGRMACVLSVSVTHKGLQQLAKRYLEEETSRSQGFKNIEVYVFTEADTKSLVEEILLPAAAHYMGHDSAGELFDVFGVDGDYGRHYSFLKSIAAFWNVLIDPEIKATFKIDLDQVFPQKELVEQSKATAFEHFKTALWGAHGVDSEGRPTELGLIAGALVNEKDISNSLFTPDIAFQDKELSSEDKVFFSRLPQALSTEAEIMTHYTSNNLDGRKTCIQRIHVTGGTNGILVDSLRKHRPFTPSFIGRAEDQAYILSVLLNPEESLAYVHKDGLIMRHDKEAFAQDAIKAASSGKLVGDYIRILFFSEYARVLSNDVSKLKNVVDPFTGCFISMIPTTVVFLRFCLKAASFFANEKNKQGTEFVTMGAPRIQSSLNFVAGENSLLRQSYNRERLGWDLYYDVMASIEEGLKEQDPFALALRNKAKDIIRQCLISGVIDGS